MQEISHWDVAESLAFDISDFQEILFRAGFVMDEAEYLFIVLECSLPLDREFLSEYLRLEYVIFYFMHCGTQLLILFTLLYQCKT